MRRSSELNENDAQLIASPAFDAVASLFADGRVYGKLVDYGYGDSFIPVQRSSVEIDTNVRVIHLSGDYVLTRDTISIIKRRGLGKLAVEADALEMLRKVDIDTINGMRNTIDDLVQQNNRTFGRSLFKEKSY